MSDDNGSFAVIDPDRIPKHFDAAAAERRWSGVWEERGDYRYDPSRPREETFVVDTPPPTVSGSLHIGHVYSYVHTDVLVRYKRMRGFNIFYPMGWDDNGLPTERRVQNYFHVRCDAKAPHESELELEPATAKLRKKPPRLVSRTNFIDLCHAVTREDEQGFMELWRRAGLSVDWTQEYATIDERSRHLAQLSFLDLHAKGHAYIAESPTAWDVDFQTAVAQAEMEDRRSSGAFHHIEFGVHGRDSGFVIATTRPELLPACVGVTAHPEDARYRDLFGKQAVTPLFRVPVPIFPSELADPEKGTGILMVCTFGDATDVDWWRAEGLALRQVIGRNGRLQPVAFGDEPFPSQDPAAANACYEVLAGQNIKQARNAVVELLRDPSGSATGSGAPLQGEPQPLEHAVKYYEKGDRPLELIPTRQWFVRLMDKKAELVQMGDRIKWHPDFMRMRYRDWTENLQVDWCISRQRYFGVPIPVWYRVGDDGQPDHEQPLLPAADQLPIDPTVVAPAGMGEEQRDVQGGFTAEADIFDTWFTSSMTPQIGSHWTLDPERHGKLFPADVRPQSHDIIRTWAFYTIAKAMLHENSVPWHHAVISGWVLDPDRKKMSKSVGNVVTPLPLLEKFTADGARYWSASARLGTDTAADEKIFKVGKRLQTKIYNAGKFVLSQRAAVHPVSAELDRAFVGRLRVLVQRATESFEAFNHAQALTEAEGFFWTHFTDTYLELVKTRARGEAGESAAEQGSAVATLRLGLGVLLRLLAPFLPYVTEEVWSWTFAAERNQPTIHRAPWPSAAELQSVAQPDDERSFDLAVACWSAINRRKAEASVSLAREISSLRIAAEPSTLDGLRLVLGDVLAAARSRAHELEERADIEAGELQVLTAEFAPAPAD